MKKIIFICIIMFSITNVFAKEKCNIDFKNYNINNIYGCNNKNICFFKGTEYGKSIFIKNLEKINLKYNEIGDLAFAKNGNIFVYSAKENGKWFLIKNNEKISKGYDKIRYNIMISDNGNNIIFKAKENGKWFLIKNGKKISKGYNDIYNIKTNPNFDKISFIGKKNGKGFLNKEGVEIGEGYNDVKYFIYSKNFDKISFIGKKNGQYFLNKEGVEIGEGYDDVNFMGEKEFLYSPNGIDIIFTGKKNEKWFLIKNGKKVSKGYKYIFYPKFDQNGNIFYKVDDFGKSYIFKNNKIFSNVYDRIESIIINKNSYMFSANKNGKSFIIKDGVEYSKNSGIKYGQYKYSPDGKNIAYEAYLNGKKIFLNQKNISEKYNRTGDFYFSDNSKHLVFTAYKDYKKYIIRDGDEIFQTFDNIKIYLANNSNKFFFTLYNTNNGTNKLGQIQCNENIDKTNKTINMNIYKKIAENIKKENSEANIIKNYIVGKHNLKNSKYKNYIKAIDKFTLKISKEKAINVLSKIYYNLDFNTNTSKYLNTDTNEDFNTILKFIMYSLEKKLFYSN